MRFRASTYADMAIFMMDDIDLSSASQSELDDLAVSAIAHGFGFVVEPEEVSGVGWFPQHADEVRAAFDWDGE